MDIYCFVRIFIISIFESLIVLLTFFKVIQKSSYLKENKLKFSIFIFIYFIFKVWINVSLSVGYISIVSGIFLIILLSVFEETKFKIATIVVLLAGVYFGVIVLAYIGIFSFFNHLSTTKSIELLNSSYKFAITIRCIEFFIILILYKLKKTILKFQEFKYNDSIIAYWILGVFLMILFSLSLTNVVNGKVNILLYQVLIFILFIFFIIVGIIDYNKRSHLAKIRSKFELKEEYTDNLEGIIDIIRKEKNDFYNHISTIYTMCILNRPDTLERVKDYLKKTTNNLEASYKFFNTGNDYIDGLIAVKSNFAFQNNIYLDVDFEAALDSIMAEDNDLVGIISNVLDNAFEAFNYEESIDKKIVSIYGYIENNIYYLSIANNGPMVPKEIQNKIFKKGFSTKSKDKNDHGFGLYIVNQLIRENGGEIVLSSSPEETEFLIQFQINIEYCQEVR
ncbi:ATP-binding protein [Clostridium aestuarii]|uniref:ATP-binding protein n=1 Tax=Clostridium aestuarii TaxID=338193 RepID=A0ABT4CV33_9CLOT|nr:ATP-binding protein [Clostridium aestuarii]MCY6482829.1 ATP-binding protein [Clostridium aestuarii]